MSTVVEDFTDDGEPIFSVEGKDGWRIRVVRSDVDDTYAPDGDALAPTFMIYQGAVNPITSVYQDDKVTDRVLSRAIAHLGGSNAERYLRMFYGVRDVQIATDYRGMEWWILDTPGFRKHVGTDGPEYANVSMAKSDRETWQAYADGDVFGLVTEMSVVTTINRVTVSGVPLGGHPVTYTEWIEHDSVWGFYGEKFATDEAKMMAERMDE